MRKFMIRTARCTAVDDSNQHLGQLINAWLSEAGPNAIFKNCGNCTHMQKQGPAVCGKFNMTPPVEVILAGCPEHDDEAEDEIPF